MDAIVMSLRIGNVHIFFCKVSMIQSSEYLGITSTSWESDLLVGNNVDQLGKREKQRRVRAPLVGTSWEHRDMKLTSWGTLAHILLQSYDFNPGCG